MGVLGILLHMVLPNNFGMAESHLVTQLCAKVKSNVQHSNSNGALNQSLLGANGDPSDTSVDPTVAAEQERVAVGTIDDSTPVVIKDLRLSYQSLLQTLKDIARQRIFGTMPRPPKQAVQGVTLALKPGECFGLLGCAGPLHSCTCACASDIS